MPGSRTGSTESREAAVAAARAAAAKQAEHIAILDVHGLIVITDYFVICSGASERQVKTIVEEVERALRELDRRPVRREGETEGRWVLLDYVDVVVHVFAHEEREYYDLERLWRDAPRPKWEEGSSSEAVAPGGDFAERHEQRGDDEGIASSSG